MLFKVYLSFVQFFIKEGIRNIIENKYNNFYCKSLI